MPSRPKLSDQLRQIIDGSGVSRYRICMDADIDQASMSRFMSGRRGLSLEALDRLAEVLDLRVETGPPASAGTSKSKQKGR